MATIQATFGFDTSKAKSDLNSLEQHARSITNRIKADTKGGFATGAPHIRDFSEAEKSVGKLATAHDLAARKTKVNWDSVRSLSQSYQDFAAKTAHATRAQEYFNSVISKRRGRGTGVADDEGITKYFKRDIEKRTELAFSRFASDIVKGDLGGAFEHITGRVSHLGLAMGIAIGAGTAVVVELTRQIRETAVAYGDLEARLQRPIAGLGLEGIKKELAAVDQLTTEYGKKLTSFGSGFRRLLVGLGIGKLPEGEKLPEDELRAGFARQNQLDQARVGAESELLDIKERAQSISEEDAAIAKTELDAKEKSNEIDQETLDRKEKIHKILRDDEALKQQLGSLAGLLPGVKQAYEEELQLIGQTDEARKQSVEREKALDQERIRNKANVAAALRAIQRAQADDAIRGQSPEEAKRRQQADRLGEISDRLENQRMPREEREQLLGERAGTRAGMLEEATKNMLNPRGLWQDLNRGILARQQRRALMNDLKQRFKEDQWGTGSQFARRDFNQEGKENTEAINSDLREANERMRYHGFNREEAEQMMRDEGTFEQPQTPEPQQQQQQQAEPLGQLPDKVANAVAAVMREYWSNA
jgi:hypothetical protein